MLEDKLLLVAGFKYHRILVEGANASRELDAAEEVNGDGDFILAGRVEERILYILRRLVFHLPISLLELETSAAEKLGQLEKNSGTLPRPHLQPQVTIRR